MTDRPRVSSGASYEPIYGYSRAVRAGNIVVVAGTAPIWPDGSCDPDPGVQARRCLDIIVHALSELGASAADVVRTRMYITDVAYADEVGKAHGAVFAGVRPATSMVVVAGLLEPEWKVEIEAEAVLT